MIRKTTSNNRIIKTRKKHAEVMACPGSGKSTTLLQRIKHLFLTIPAEQILILSFSNASVNELKNRIKAFTKSDEVAASKWSKVTVQTAHAFSLTLIKQQEVLTEKKAHALLKKSLNSLRRDCNRGELWPDVSIKIKQRRTKQLEELLQPHNIKEVLNLLTVARASKQSVSNTVIMSQFESLVQYVKVLRAVCSKYASAKKTAGVIDYTDMLVRAATVIEGGTTIPYTHILVDEYQDCSAAQTHLLAQLATSTRCSLMVFGDKNQAIFGFAGSSYTPLSSVLDGVQQLTLPVSYRLTAQTAALASAVAQLSVKQSIQTKSDGDMPTLIKDTSLKDQLAHIVQHIQELLDGGTQPQQIAVLARTKAQLHTVEQSLLGQNVQTSRMGSKWNRKHVLRVLRLVRIVERCEKSKKKITPKMLRNKLSCSAGKSIWKDASLALGKASRSSSLEGRYKQCAKVYLRLMGGVRADAELRADVNRWEPYCRGHVNALAMRDTILAMNTKSVVTGTIHAAKGREWEHVLITGLTDGLLPIHYARDERALGEERNLLFVAITRARNTVRLYHAPTNHARSRQRFEDISRFLKKPAVRKTLRVV